MARRPDPDPIIAARLTGTARRYATSADPAAHRAAVAKLRAIAGDRPDLLAEQAGLIWGFFRYRYPGLREAWPFYNESAVVFLLDAGADVEAVPRWFEEGARRAAWPR
jgi:hypothetical protein